MGKLGGFSYKEVAEKLKKFGFAFLREAKGSHEVWHNPQKELYTTIPHHKEIKEETLSAILKQCKISPKAFFGGLIISRYSHGGISHHSKTSPLFAVSQCHF